MDATLTTPGPCAIDRQRFLPVWGYLGPISGRDAARFGCAASGRTFPRIFSIDDEAEQETHAALRKEKNEPAPCTLQSTTRVRRKELLRHHQLLPCRLPSTVLTHTTARPDTTTLLQLQRASQPALLGHV